MQYAGLRSEPIDRGALVRALDDLDADRRAAASGLDRLPVNFHRINRLLEFGPVAFDFYSVAHLQISGKRDDGDADLPEVVGNLSDLVHISKYTPRGRGGQSAVGRITSSND